MVSLKGEGSFVDQHNEKSKPENDRKNTPEDKKRVLDFFKKNIEGKYLYGEAKLVTEDDYRNWLKE